MKLSVTSGDGLTTRDYTVKVNVYAIAPDTLYWNPKAKRSLPTALAAPIASKTVTLGDETICLTTDGTEAYIACSTDLYENVWTGNSVTLPAGADIATLTASDAGLFIIGDGMLYHSATTASPSWTSTGAKMDYIYGIYPLDGRVLGNMKNPDGSYSIVTYPATTVTPVPAEMPVSGTSAMLSVDSKWSFSPVALMLGGRLASGKCTGDAWGYDGSSWSSLSTRAVVPGEQIAVCRYPVVEVNTSSWTFTVRQAILAIGGQDALGRVDNLVNVSYDEGITWNNAATYLDLPEGIHDRGGADLIVRNRSLDLSTATDWSSVPFDRLRPADFPLSRAVKPVTEWECPYLYMFGGHDSDGKLFNEEWRGVINRYTFVPVY